MEVVKRERYGIQGSEVCLCLCLCLCLCVFVLCYEEKIDDNDVPFFFFSFLTFSIPHIRIDIGLDLYFGCSCAARVYVCPSRNTQQKI